VRQYSNQETVTYDDGASTMPDRRTDDVKADDYMTVRELNTHFSGIHTKLGDIHKQTITTNGRVGKLESWRDRIIGGMAVMTILVVPILLYITKQWIQGNVHIDSSIIDTVIAILTGA